MPIIKVKKPFEPNPSASHSKLTSPAVQVTEINPDEEKPVVEPTSKTSEDFHGGNELSFSLPNTSVSSPPMPTSSQSSTSSSSEQQLEPSSPSSASETPKTEASEQQQLQPESSSQQSSESSVQQQQLESSEQTSQTLEVSSSSETLATASTTEASEQQSITSSSSESLEQQSIASSSVSEQLESSSSYSEQSSQISETSSSSSSEASTSETSAQYSTLTGQASEQVQAKPESMHEEVSEGSESDEGSEESKDSEDSEGAESEGNEDSGEDKKQVQSYTFNTQQAFDVVNDADFSARYYQTEFYRFIEMIAEEKTKFFDPSGAEEYNVKKLMFRPFERKPLQHYRMARVRESVVLILDNSGSMTWWSTNIQMLARLAMQRNDVEVYLAPNGVIEEMIHPRSERVVHSEVMKKLRNRKIIYVGDFDGANTPIELSWYNDVVWICPEKRYKHFREHDWVSYDEDRFKGVFLRVFTLEQMFSAFKKLLSSPSLKLWYDLFDEYTQDEDEDMS
jgi:hypothetical protein